MFTIAALHALLMTLMERRLHGGALVGPLAALPPLLTMERLLFQIILAGFVFLTLTLATGIAFSETALRPRDEIRPQDRVRRGFLAHFRGLSSPGAISTAGGDGSHCAGRSSALSRCCSPMSAAVSCSR